MIRVRGLTKDYGDLRALAPAEAARVGDLAHESGVPLHLLEEVGESLESVFWSLTEDAVEYRGSTGPAAVEAAR